MLYAAINPKAVGQVYNLGGEPISLLELAKLMVECNGSGSFSIVPFPEDRKAIDIGHYYGSFDKIKTDLGWKPQVSLREGVDRTLSYYKDHLCHYV